VTRSALVPARIATASPTETAIRYDRGPFLSHAISYWRATRSGGGGAAGCGLLASSAEADMLAMMARRSRPQSPTQATPHIHLYPKSWTAKLTGATEVLYGIADCCAPERPRHRRAEQRDELASFQLIELHSNPASQGRIVDISEDHSAGSPWRAARQRPRCSCNNHQPLLDCAPRTRSSMSSTARLASASFCGSRARSTTLVLGPRCGSKNG
jgi:hypothetical protein